MTSIGNVALVSEHASPIAALGGRDAGGQNVYVAALADALARRGVNVTVFTRRDAPDLPRRLVLGPRVTLEHVDAGPPQPVPKDSLLPFMKEFGDELRRLWRLRQPDVVHAHYWMSGLAVRHAAIPLQIPTVQTFHALGVTKRRYQGAADASPPARVRVETELASAVDAVAATSGEEIAELRRSGARPRLAEVVPCGVDTTLFTPGDCSRGSSRRIVAVGRLVERKGMRDLIRCIPRLPEANLVIGGGTDHHDDDAEALRGLARRLGVTDRVQLLGPLEHRDVPALLRSASVVACTPWYEPFGMVALEAMACGVPVVATAVGGLRDTVVDGETGIHVPPQDPARLTTALATVLDDATLRERLGERGAERAASRYTWTRVSESLLHLYERAAGRRTS